jgi:Ca2+-binding RTX toxin-like protein
VRATSVVAIIILALLPTTSAEAQSTPMCFGREATIVGTDARDFLQGTSGTDVIAALGSRDDISGSPVNTRDLKDFLCGGGHNDTISGGPGNDSLAGEDGKDRPSGGWGNDTILGGNGADRLKPGAGADFADGGPGTDIIDNENDDEPGVDEREDLLRGGIGNDIIAAGYATGSDALFGDTGDDYIEATHTVFFVFSPTGMPTDGIPEVGGPDYVNGGAGHDRCVVDDDDIVVNCERVLVLS